MATQRGTQTQPGTQAKAPAHTYQIEGTVMEACNCDTLCPCHAGGDPTHGSCEAIFAYHIDRGQISGVDVGNLTVVAVVHAPGNMEAGNWKRALLVDDQGTVEQLVAIGDAFEGRLGGPLADLAGLVKEHAGVFEMPISYTGGGGQASISVGDKLRTSFTPGKLRSSMVPTRGMTEAQTGTPGTFPWGTAPETSVNLPEQGITWSVQGKHASYSTFHFEA